MTTNLNDDLDWEKANKRKMNFIKAEKIITLVIENPTKDLTKKVVKIIEEERI